jgi:hypothetical protein
LLSSHQRFHGLPAQALQTNQASERHNSKLQLRRESSNLIIENACGKVKIAELKVDMFDKTKIIM